MFQTQPIPRLVRMSIGQYDSSLACHYCGRYAADTPEGYAHPVCYTCRLRSEFSDTYKEENGSRPDLSRWTNRQMEDWLTDRWD
jgi:hypothetical protein